MSDRSGYQFTSSPNPKLWMLDGYVAVSTSGTVLNTTAGTNLDAAGLPLYLPRGIKSVVRNSTGNYTITFGKAAVNAPEAQTDSYQRLLHVDVTPVCPVVTSIGHQVVSWNLAAGGLASNVSSVTIQFVTSGSAADLPTNGGFTFSIHASNSQVGR